MEVFEAVSSPENIPLVRQLEGEIQGMEVPSVTGKVKGKDVVVRCSASGDEAKGRIVTCTATVVEMSPQPRNVDIETTREAPKIVQSLLDDIEWRLKA